MPEKPGRADASRAPGGPLGFLILAMAGGFALAVLALAAGSGVALAFLVYALSGVVILVGPIGRLALAEVAARPRGARSRRPRVVQTAFGGGAGRPTAP